MFFETTLRAAAGVAALIFSVAASALAQPSIVIGGPSDVTAPLRQREAPVTAEELARYASVLSLDGDQAALAHALHETMKAEHAALLSEHLERYRALQEKFSEENDVEVVVSQIPKLAKEFGERQEELGRQFISDLRLLLTAEQEPLWPAVERMRRRIQLLPQGHTSGEAVDLVELLHRIEATPEQGTPGADMLHRYEVELDEELKKREALIAEQPETDVFAGGFSEETLTKLSELSQRRKTISLAVQGINERYGRLLRTQIDPSLHAAYDEALQKASFPHVYRKTFVHAALSMAGAFSELTDEQKAELERVSDEYERKLDEVNRRWADALKKAEQEGGDRDVVVFGGGTVDVGAFAFGDESEELASARDARRELDDAMLERVRTLVGDELAARIPDRSRLGRFDPAFGGDGAVVIEEIDIAPDGSERRMRVVVENGGAAGAGDGEEIVVEEHVEDAEEGEDSDENGDSESD